jgi:hypothetical protein
MNEADISQLIRPACLMKENEKKPAQAG